MSDSKMAVADLERMLLDAIHVATVMYLDARKYLNEIDPNNETHTFVLDMHMYELAVQFKNHPIGDCDACFSRSPLKAGQHEGLDAMVCAWDEGCK
jgi:hypothetical protein